MNPFITPVPALDPASQQKTNRLVSTAQDLLFGEITVSKIERSRELLIEALHRDPCALGGRPLLVAAVALRAIHYHCLPSGQPNPYRVFGLIPDIPIARDPALIEAYYRQASDLLNHESLNCAHPCHPCYPAFSTAARLVADAWAFLSDADRKASLDSRFTTPVTSHPPAATTTPPTPAATTTPPSGDVAQGRRASSRIRKPSVLLAGAEWI